MLCLAQNAQPHETGQHPHSAPLHGAAPTPAPAQGWQAPWAGSGWTRSALGFIWDDHTETVLAPT